MPRVIKKADKNIEDTKKTKKKSVSAVKTKVVEKESDKLSVPVFSLIDKGPESITLPKQIFASKINKPLLSQAIRVYLNNQLAHHTHTKTRSEVTGSTRKIQTQKGTGHARHGSIRAPIFVHGGIAIGPKSRKTILDLSKKMRRLAFISALSDKAAQSQVFGVSGLESIKGKTSEMKKLTEELGSKMILIVIDSENNQLLQASRNLKNMTVVNAKQINILDIMRHNSLLFTENAITKLEERLTEKK